MVKLVAIWLTLQLKLTLKMVTGRTTVIIVKTATVTLAGIRLSLTVKMVTVMVTGIRLRLRLAVMLTGKE